MGTRSSLLLLVLFVSLSAAACAGSDDNEGESTDQRLSRKGESCAATNDCAVGLACVDDVCIPEDLGLPPTGKECVAVECTAPEDCCALVMQDPITCDNYQQQCQLGDQFSCDWYNMYCVCTASDWSCQADECSFSGTCMTSNDCLGGICNNGTCVECLTDIDCGASGTCTNNRCSVAVTCEDDNDCAFFHSCQNSACVEVGCTTNRECIELTDDPLAFCETGECRVQCATDAECVDFVGELRTCVEGFCEDAGCETDEQCRIQLGLFPGSPLTAVCRDEAPSP